MKENKEQEQYFFDEATLKHLVKTLSSWSTPCCLCTPLLGKRLVKDGVPARILDIDERFSDVPGFTRFDIERPVRIAERFDLIVCDPPFFNVSLTRLRAAIKWLSHYDFEQPILLCYLQRRSSALLEVFAEFNLQPTGYMPSYDSVEPVARNDIEFFSNVPGDVLGL